MPRHYERIIRAVARTPWAIEPRKGAYLYAFFRLKASGVRLSEAEIAAAVDATAQAAPRQQRSGAVAVLRLNGTIMHRAEQVDDISGPGGTSAEKFGRRFDEAIADPNVAAVAIDIDSPGGMVPGTPELAAKIASARGSKPIVAVANAQAASAAYWIATAADEIVVTPSGEVGSIGVWTAHEDWSRQMEIEGVKTSLIYAGRYKVEGNPFEPLSDEARAALQQAVDDSYAMFVADVARNRRRSIDEVRGGFGEGRTVGAGEAVRLGMADRVATLDETVARLGRGSGGGRKSETVRRRLALA